MSEPIRIGMAESAVAKAPGEISTLGLGSCIGFCAYDSKMKVGGMVHIMLPASTMAVETSINSAKFADTAIPELIAAMEKLGAKREQIVIKIVGGAVMFNVCQDERLSVGSKNIQAVEATCQKLGLAISARSIGGHAGKSVFLNLDTGEVQIRTLNEISIL